MIPEIGVMVGAYIVVGMLALIAQRVDPALNVAGKTLVWIVKVAALGAIVVATFVMFDLSIRGTESPSIPSMLRP